jgi:superfamily II DNA or RNA helicase
MKGQNSSVELPTGTGKTLIACLAAAFWKQLRPGSRILLVVPSRTLVVQHFGVALWLAQTLRVDRISDDQSGDPGSLRRTLLQSDLLISTPGILASAIARGVVDESVVNSFDLIIVDEFDQFVVIDEADTSSVARYAELWQRLVGHLPPSARYLVKSATLGLAATDGKARPRTKADHRARLIAKRLNPERIDIPESSYAAVVPFKSVRMRDVHDRRVAVLLEAVRISKGIAHLTLDQTIGFVDYTEVERRAPQLCTEQPHRTVRFWSPGGGMRLVQITAEVKQLFCAIAKLLMMPQHLVEDLTRDIGCEIGNCMIKNRRNEEVFLENVPRLRDEREEGRFRFRRGGKVNELQSILEARSKARERGVVFVRTVTLLEALKPILAKLGLPLFELIGEKDDLARKVAIEAFQKSTNGLLLMTRTTGGRGLDLPFAHYAVFYSPKSEPVTMWQEMSRIRSTISNPKDIYVLCYGEPETAVIERVVAALQAQRRQIILQ